VNIQAVTPQNASVPAAAIPPPGASPSTSDRIAPSPERETGVGDGRARDGSAGRADQAQDGLPGPEAPIGGAYDRAGTAARPPAATGSISILA
jgi:hypothetical protein